MIYCLLQMVNKFVLSENLFKSLYLFLHIFTFRLHFILKNAFWLLICHITKLIYVICYNILLQRFGWNGEEGNWNKVICVVSEHMLIPLFDIDITLYDIPLKYELVYDYVTWYVQDIQLWDMFYFQIVILILNKG